MRAILLLSTICALFLQPSLSADDSLKVMTFNLRYASNSKPNAWPDRLLPGLDVCAHLLKADELGVVGDEDGRAQMPVGEIKFENYYFGSV